MNIHRHLIFLGLALILLVACSERSFSPTIAYYHWKNSYHNHQDLLQQYPTQHLYLKLLDIGYRQKRLQVHRTRLIDAPDDSLEVRPVVFLDNRALKQADVTHLRQLITQSIPPQQYTYLQMDCDWTASTRDKFFHLLRQLQQDYAELSATIRLHQVKYAAKTGVPPVNVGVLMYYNMSDLRDPKTRNYVLDHQVGQEYLQNFTDYPLPLDLALPLYQQVRVIRQGQMALLLPLVDMPMDKLELLPSGRYRVREGSYWQGEYLYPNDELVLDTVTLPDLQAVVATLAQHMNPREVIFYSYQNARRFSHADLQGLLASFDELPGADGDTIVGGRR